MPHHFRVGLGALTLALASACRGDPAPDSTDDIDLDERFAPGSNLADDDTAAPGPSAWSDRIDGRTYRLDLYAYTSGTPSGLIDLIIYELGIEPLVMVTSSSTSTIDLLASVAEPGSSEQYPCVPTDVLSGTFSSAPAFSVSAPTGHMALPYWSTDHLTTREVILSGTVSDDGTELQGVTFSALIDFRDGGDIWRDIIGTDDPYEMCAVLEGFGARCEECGDGDGEDLCMPISIAGVPGRVEDDLTLVTVTEEDAATCR